MVRLEALKGSHLFRNLSNDRLQSLVSISREETHEPGRLLCREGDQARYLCILEEGKTTLEMGIAPFPEPRQPVQVTVDAVGPGEILGWSALVEPRVFTFSARAVGRCRVIAIDADKLLDAMDSDPVMGYEVMKQLSAIIGSRLVRSRQALISERGLALLSQVYSYSNGQGVPDRG